ncbi:S8 family serine peptidase [Curtobacterium sp. ODYSSEY 48 V2]|uniref:S8 family peptidase n=1 Tax=Curtobacterium sp. ODYSSEY 48 V2 TaxID=2939561 RepID=UPI002041A0AC|nr:S8 family serine peptidase [Curtobacterium sp. ODYSSEY 48 V2]MCM3503499.1 S8 family serine peptidase [Curtobacterium sp. ODYSSEY 48 V2]
MTRATPNRAVPEQPPTTERTTRSRVARILTAGIAAVALSCGGLAVGGAANAAPSGLSAADLKLAAPLRDAKPQKTVAAFVRTTGQGALEVDAKAKGGDLTKSKTPSSAAKERVQAITSTVDAVRAAVKRSDATATELYSTEYTVPGVAVVADVDALRDIASRSDVESIIPLTPKKIVDPTPGDASKAPSGVDPDLVQPGADGVSPKNAASDVYTRSLDAWQQTGRTGKGVNVAVLDTGLDYTQADFGGPGTTAAYEQALASTSAPDPSWFDAKKYLGGYDFAGPTYNADSSSAGYDPTPKPDANPIDGKGGDHGTHVSGTAAGYGLTADKKTFRGDYTKLTNQSVQDMWIGPGTAPDAGLYALKVFGDGGGSTDLTGAALDWVGQALTEGKDINVLNLSLGSDYGAPDDPDNAKIDALTARGVLPVIASGNADDFTDIGGSPGNAEGALTVAASATGQSLFDGVKATAPSDVAGTYRAQYSQNYQGTLPVEGDVVVPTTNIDGCAAFSADEAAKIKGKVVWLKWTDGALECGSGVRFTNVQAAGGVGVLLAGTVTSFDSGIAGNATIPGAELTSDSAASLQAAATAGTLHVQFAQELKGFQLATDQANVNTLAPFTSRGVHGSFDDIVKPDVAGPGVNVISAANGTGDGRMSMSGTSMATPHVAGIVALTFQSHPSWTAPQVKAAVMNTATHDVRQGDQNATLLRQGAGRVDALQAVTAGTTVRSIENDQLVTASYGVVEVSGKTTESRTLQIQNTDGRPHTYDVAYQAQVDQPGVAFSLSTKRVTAPAHGTATVKLTYTIADPTQLRRVIDPTQESVQSGYQREFVAAESGVVSFTPTDAKLNPMRLGAYVAPKPVSAVHGKDIAFSGSTTTAELALTGRSVDQGDAVTGYHSSVAPFVLGGTDPQEPLPAGSAKQSLQAADVRAYGANYDEASDTLAFGVQTAGADANPGAVTNVEVLIDTDRDGEPDYLVYDAKSATVDATLATTVDLATGKTVDAQPLNGGTAGQDVNTFDSAVKVLTVSASTIGATGPFDYSVLTESAYAPALATSGSNVVDETDPATYDPSAPALTFAQGTPTGVLYADKGALQVTRQADATNARVLLLHLGNAVGDQADVLQAAQTAPTLTLREGSAVTISGTPKVGKTLKAKPGSWDGKKVSYSYQWLRDGVAVQGATDQRYTLGTTDAGHRFSVEVTAKATGYQDGSATSAETAKVAPRK